MVEIIIAVAAEVVKCLVASIKGQFNYLCSRKSNFEELEIEVGKLKAAKDRVQRKVDDDLTNVKRIKPNVEKWQDSVNKIIDEAEQFIKEKKANNRCFKGVCPNLFTTNEHGKEAKKKVEAVADLLREEKEFVEVADNIIHEDIWLTSTDDYEAFESRMSPLNDIFKALKDVGVYMIGVYGMGGIGKTTLVQEVGRQAKKDKLFNKVVFVEISETPDITKIQEVIADKLGLEFKNETERASKLYARLKNEKRILIILDNIWTNDLDLKKIGIPVGDDPEGCKLLLTTRDYNVLESMGAKPFPINVLNEKEGWSLFKKMAGDYIENREWKPIAIDVVKECGGLPIAIVTVARALRNKRVSEWKDALRQLRRPSPTNFEGVLAKAYSTIELSYTYLTNELKKTFLLCSLMAHDASILDLLKYAMGLDLLDGDIPKIEDARNRLDKLVRELKDSCLLLHNDTNECFPMHDVVRAVAISIAHRDHLVIIVRNGDSIEWSAKDNLEKCTKISILYNNISELPEVLECPQLELFHMDRSESSLRISDKFFTEMKKLKVLSLLRVRLLSLPSSLYLLINLQTLCLDHNKLENIAIIGELKKLKILSLRDSKIKQLPREIGQLTQLRLLDLSNCFKLKVIAPNVISYLSRLEDLYMSNCSIQWEVEGHNVARSKASLDELKHLSALTSLEIDIEDDKILPKGFFSKKLERYKISVGDTRAPFMMKSNYSRALKLKLQRDSSICLEELQAVIKNVQGLYLDGLKGLKNVFYELDKEGFPQLNHLHIENNHDFWYIVDSIDSVPYNPLPLLELLFLNNLSNLKKIFHRQLPMYSFWKLKSIEVNNCGKLENIFSFSHAKGLPQLQDIYVSNCQKMKEIFVIEEEDDVNNNEVTDNIEFLQLRSLYLDSLPQLTNFHSKVMTPSTSLKRLKIESQSTDIILNDEFDAPTSIFNAKDFLPNLEVLKLFGIDSEKIWQSQMSTTSPCYQNLTRLILCNCRKLKYVFFDSMAKSLEQLQHLEIWSCRVLKHIIAKDRVLEAVAEFVFPRITFLRLEDLPELITFYPGTHILHWPMLKTLTLCSCDKLNIFSSEYFGFNDYNGGRQLEEISGPQSLFLINRYLEELTLGEKEIKMIRQQPHFLGDLSFFGSLKVLEIKGDKSANVLVEIFQRFKNLEKLKLAFNSYKNIFSCRQDQKHVGTLTRIKNLEIISLNDLKYFWNQDSILDSIFQNLEILSMKGCDKLVNIASSSASFRNLTVLEVEYCNGLQSLVTSSIAKSLVQLREMTIGKCNMMVEIVENEKDETRNEIVFDKLKSLYLHDLESLTIFYSGNYTLNFPSLEEFIVKKCPKMKSFSIGFLNTPKLQKVNQEYWDEDEGCWEGDLNTTIQQLHKKEVNSNSKELILSGDGIWMIKQGQFPEHYYLEIKVLEVIKDESTHIPLKILQKFNHLEKLILKVSSYEEIFSYEDGEKHAEMLTPIKILELWGLFGLKYLWKQDSQLDSILQNLKILEVCYCHNLTNLMPSSASFENLTTLSVWYCDGLKNLVTIVTAKSMVQLKKMKIGDCEMIMEIVANEGGVANEEIVFSKLKTLSLVHLESLASFCFGNYTFKFPELKELIVDGCPKMKTFSGGILSTPRLQEVKQSYWSLDERCWDNDLNTTIKQLHKKMSLKKDSGQFLKQPPK